MLTFLGGWLELSQIITLLFSAKHPEGILGGGMISTCDAVNFCISSEFWWATVDAKRFVYYLSIVIWTGCTSKQGRHRDIQRGAIF